MGVFRNLFTGTVDPVISDAIRKNSEPQFAIDESSVPAEIFGLTSYASPVNPSPRIDRRSAMQVPAVKRSRDLIAGTLGTLPIDLIGPDKRAGRSNLLEQPEKDVPRSVTMARTFEDLLCEGVAWWRITEFGWHGYPTKVIRLNPRSVNVMKNGKVLVTKKGHSGTVDEWVQDAELIRFDSPNDGLLIAGARAIRTCLHLDNSAQNYAEGAPPIDYFTPTEGADPADDDDIVAVLDAWKTARQTRATGYVPASLKYNVGGWSPEQLQLHEARQHAVLEIARIAGVDPEELGVSTTSRTYANQFDRRKAFLDFTLGGYRAAIEDRLSMGDVTPNGYIVRFNLDSFLRTDAKTRYETYKVGLEVGAIDQSEIRPLEDKPPLNSSEQESTVNASTDVETTFDVAPELRLDAPKAEVFEVDVERRIIKGLIVPFGVPAISNDQRWQFSQGTLTYTDPTRVKLWIQHDANRAVGHATELEERTDGMYGTFKVARGAKGDEALSLAEDKVLDGFSIGLGRGGKFRRDRAGINHAVSVPLMETSLTPAPSFDDARVHHVAASATTNQKGSTVMECDKCKKVHPEGVTQCATEFSTEENPLDFSAITEAITKGFESLQNPQGGGRETVSAGAQFEVTEKSPYRFDGIRGEHEFSTDLINGLKFGDSEAMQRVNEFIEEAFTPQFDVDTSDVSAVNPNRNRPEMYVDRLDYELPFYNALYKGALQDATPFTFPKFASASGLVDDHTQGVEPTPGAFTATNQTVTPSPVSGKVEITREVWDQGGNPQVSTLIWNEMKRSYFEALEAKAVAVLDAASPTAIALTTAASDDALVNELEDAIASLQFIRGGMRFNFMGTHIDLYKALAAAVDSTGRKLLPILNPTNANGSSQPRFRALDVAGITATPAWSLGASGTVSESSYLVNSGDVHVWNSAPQRLEFQYRVAYVDLAIWGYVATAISRLDGVREVTYDPAA